MTLNGNEINLSTSVILPFRDKFGARKLIRKQLLLLHMMLKQGKTWFTLENDNREPNMTSDNVWNTHEWTIWIKFIYQFILGIWQDIWTPIATLPQDFFCIWHTIDAIQVVLKIKMKWGKHMLTEDQERRTEKYRPWEKCTQWVIIRPIKRVEPISLKRVHDSGSSSDSGTWVQVGGDLEYTPKVFNDPKNTSSDKENDPMNDSQATIALNGLNIIDKTGCKETQDFLDDHQTL